MKSETLAAGIDRRFWWILALAAFFIFFRLSHVDMTGDDAHYSARAVGLADFMFGNAPFQSTPLLWFDKAPWWSHLSFHDHPIMLFFIQHVFLSVHESVLFAKLPYALLALGSVLLMYLWTKKLFGNTAGLFAGLLLTLHAHFIWTGRVSFMEAGVIFFILLTFLTLARFIEDPTRSWWEFGLAFGFALAAKFTTLFLLPTVAVFFLLAQKAVIKKKESAGAAAVALIVVLPTLLYNAFMYYETGHFSLQFARLLGQGNPWALSGVRTTDFFGGAKDLFLNIALLMSWPYAALFLFAVLFALYQRERRMLLHLLGLLFLTIQQMFIGQGGYVLALYSVFAAPFVAWLCMENYSRIPRGAGVLAAIYLAVFVLNSHTLIRHAGTVGWAHSSVTSDNVGMAQLDKRLDEMLSGNRDVGLYDIFWDVKSRDPRLHKYLTRGTTEDIRAMQKSASVVLFDGNISWFSRVWLFDRRRFYDNAPLISLNEQHLLSQVAIDDLYFIRVTEYGPLDPTPYQTSKGDEMEAYFERLGLEPALIYRDDGQVAFRVYHATSEDLRGA